MQNKSRQKCVGKLEWCVIVVLAENWFVMFKSKAAIINKCKCKIDIRINNLSKLKQLLEVSELGFVQM